SRRRHTRSKRDWSSDVCSSDLPSGRAPASAQLGDRVPSFDLDAAAFAAIVRDASDEALHELMTADERREVLDGLFQRVPSRIRRSEERRVGKEWGSGVSPAEEE